MKINSDPSYQIVYKVYNMHVPEKSELTNPFSANKRQRKKLIVPSENTIPENVNEWNSKIFVDYFVTQYKNSFKGIYKKTYTSDCSIINEILDFMSANELNEKEWTKKFIDWCFLNSDLIIKSSGSFILLTLKHQLNTFYQQVISIDKKSKPKIDIFDELVSKVNNGKTKEVLAVYGIPIIATYFINHKDIVESNIKSGLHKMFDSLLKGNYDEQDFAKKIVQRSINRSPYPDFFKLKDWRNEFPELSNKYSNETWWRDNDYIGNPQFLYDSFMKIE